MKMAKTMAIIMAIVLAVFCFNVPFAFGGDEHPWDEEGGGDGGGIDSTVPDNNGGNTNIGIIGASSSTAPSVQIGDSSLLIVLKVAFVLPTVL